MNEPLKKILVLFLFACLSVSLGLTLLLIFLSWDSVSFPLTKELDRSEQVLVQGRDLQQLVKEVDDLIYKIKEKEVK